MFESYEKLKKALTTVDSKYEEIQNALSSPDIGNDIPKMTKLKKEASFIEEAYNIHKLIKNEIHNYAQAKEMFLSKDPDFIEEAKSEMQQLEKSIEKHCEKAQILLLPKDINDNKNVVVEIKGAAGGDEANIFAGDLLKMYTRYFEQKEGFKMEVINANIASTGGYSNVEFSVKGHGAYSLLKWESGAHRVQRVPSTESKGRVHTSTATVLVMPEAEDIDVEIKKTDLKIDTFRASGAGGQHVNTTDSAIRITHIPTGIVSESQDGRSQHKNKEIAMTLLKTRIYKEISEKQAKERGDEARAKIGTGDRSEKIRTYNYPQNRVTDHRIGLTINKLEQVMQGSALQEFIDGLLSEEQRQKIENSQK